jgi:uncharacterized protein
LKGSFMLFPKITALLAIFLALLLTVLTARVIMKRQNAKVAFGDGGSGQLSQIVRTQANLTETAPMLLIVLGLAEAAGAAALSITIVAAVYAVARVAHVIGLSSGEGTGPLRTVGGAGTLLSLVAASLLAAATIFLH